MSAHFTTPTDELLLLAETLGEVKTKADKLEAEFSTQARPLEAATNALSAALSGIKALQFHVLDNNLGQLSARVEEMRKAVDEQVGVIALELKKADETNAAKAGQEAEALRSEIAALQAQLGALGAQFSAQLERVEFSAKEEAKKLQLIPGPAGAAGASLNPRGTFIDGETYNRLDVVSWLGSSYIAAVDGVTEKPSKNSNQWQVLASRGANVGGSIDQYWNAVPQNLTLGQGAGIAFLSGKTQVNVLEASGTYVSGEHAFISGERVVIAAASSLPQANRNGAFILVAGTTPPSGTAQGDLLYLPSRSRFVTPSHRWYGRADGSGIPVERMTLTNAGQLQLFSTAASISTLTGAIYTSGGIGVAGSINIGGFYGLVDGIAAPSAESGYARIYVDSADGDLKVIFGDGIIKTLATDS